MVKTKFVTDYQINASKKMLFSYLSTASGLEDWFADEVRIDEDKNFIFFFDNEEHHAKVASIRLNSHVKYDFFDPDNPNAEDHAYIEFKLEENELTQTMFLKIIDYTEDFDEEEMHAIWDGLVGKLKETIGG
ncbi:START-like domain-containing protein [Algoriphagus namhaensis]|uniref:START-like domain-containing protein n=1 Tax=Algoriphagus namhaensis TaxID=915353 RepID=A0ABV8AWC1_9BACT